jgi:hypothetical protein
MRKILLVFIPFFTLVSHAQNYQCLQPGMVHYFINGNGYLRGIRIDSTITVGDTTVYYPFHTPRGPYTPPAVTALDSNGGSWLGKRVLQKSDGTFIFDSYWNDSVIIKTQANIGDSWVFYKDTSSLYYKAIVVSQDTMSFLSVTDSVKIIMINAYNSSGIVPSDPLDSFEIILSKNYGFVQVFDLFTFPYHKPDSAYRPGLDFFLDRSTCTYLDVNRFGGHVPTDQITLFKLVDFINPNDQQLHNWNVGDTLEGYHSILSYSGGSYRDLIFETVTNKTVSAHSTAYTLSGTSYTCTNRSGICAFYSDPCSLIVNAGTYIYYDNIYQIAPPLYMPEANLHFRNYVFYFPDDGSNCIKSPAYVLAYGNIPFGLNARGPVYKLGIGTVQLSDFYEDCIMTISDGLAYTNIAGVPCGSRRDLEANNAVMVPAHADVYPNPASKILTVSASYPMTTISISNVMGQTMLTREYNTEKAEVDVANLPAGVYFVRINGTEVRKFVKK